MLGQPDRTSGTQCASGRSSDIYPGSAQRDPDEAQLPVLQSEPDRRRVGSGATRAQSGRVCSRRTAQPANGIADSLAAGGLRVYFFTSSRTSTAPAINMTSP